jgi:hypothetical protein
MFLNCLSPSLRTLRGCWRGCRKKKKTGLHKSSNNWGNTPYPPKSCDNNEKAKFSKYNQKSHGRGAGSAHAQLIHSTAPRPTSYEGQGSLGASPVLYPWGRRITLTSRRVPARRRRCASPSAGHLTARSYTLQHLQMPVISGVEAGARVSRTPVHPRPLQHTRCPPAAALVASGPVPRAVMLPRLLQHAQVPEPGLRTHNRCVPRAAALLRPLQHQHPLLAAAAQHHQQSKPHTFLATGITLRVSSRRQSRITHLCVCRPKSLRPQPNLLPTSIHPALDVLSTSVPTSNAPNLFRHKNPSPKTLVLHFVNGRSISLHPPPNSFEHPSSLRNVAPESDPSVVPGGGDGGG